MKRLSLTCISTLALLLLGALVFGSASKTAEKHSVLATAFDPFPALRGGLENNINRPGSDYKDVAWTIRPNIAEGQDGPWLVWMKTSPCSGRTDWVSVAKENPSGGGNSFVIFPGSHRWPTFAQAMAEANSLRTSPIFSSYCCREYSVWQNHETRQFTVVASNFGNPGMGWRQVTPPLCCEEAFARAGLPARCGAHGGIGGRGRTGGRAGGNRGGSGRRGGGGESATYHRLSGTWDGPWENTRGEKGNSGPLTISEDANGNVSGHWDCDIRNGRRDGNRVTFDMTCAGREYKVTVDFDPDLQTGIMNYTCINDPARKPRTYRGTERLRAQ